MHLTSIIQCLITQNYKELYMKLHKINKEGTVAVVLPKKIIEKLGWKEGDYVEVSMTENPNTLKLINFDLVTSS